MGASIPKQYLELCGRPIVAWSLRLFASMREVRDVVVVCEPEYKDLISSHWDLAVAEAKEKEKALGQNSSTPELKWALPGAERQDSVQSGLASIDPVSKLVAVHDSARPLATAEEVRACLGDALEAGAAVLGVPVKPTIKEVNDDGTVARTLVRARLWEVQTPQVIEPELLRRGFQFARERNLEVTDDVSVVELLDQLMPGADADLVRPLEKRLRKRFEAVMLRTKVKAVEALPEGLRVTFDGEAAPAPQVYDRVLVAVGRKPNGALIGAEATGLSVDPRGFIAVDKQMRTAVPHLFAIGDIVGQPMLAHKATHEGKVAAEVIAGEKRAFDARVIPSVAYTDPEVAWVGLTETEAKAKGIAYEKGMFPWAASGRSLAQGRDEGFTKLLFDPTTHRVLGGGLVGPNAGELVGEIALAIEMGADAADIGLTIHPHPTLSESIAMSAEAFEGTLTDLYIPKRR